MYARCVWDYEILGEGFKTLFTKMDDEKRNEELHLKEEVSFLSSTCCFQCCQLFFKKWSNTSWTKVVLQDLESKKSTFLHF